MPVKMWEPLSTPQFTWVSSQGILPDAAPHLSLFGPNETLVYSGAAVQSGGSSMYYQFVTLPNSEGIYLVTWTATKTFNATPYSFLKSQIFTVRAVTNSG